MNKNCYCLRFGSLYSSLQQSPMFFSRFIDEAFNCFLRDIKIYIKYLHVAVVRLSGFQCPPFLVTQRV